jgi:hypothetical protein
MSTPEKHKHLVTLEHDELMEIIDTIEATSENLHDTMKAYGEEDEEGKEWRAKYDSLTTIVDKLAIESCNWCAECTSTKCVCDVEQSEKTS